MTDRMPNFPRIEVEVPRHRRILAAVLLISLAGIGSCVFPTDRSSEVQIAIDPVPELFLKDSLQLSAQVTDAAGNPIPGAVLSYASSDPAIVSVLDASTGRMLAVGTGTATLTATALGFGAAAPATVDARVRGLIEVDSIKPRNVRFGDSLHIFGVGLNPDSLFTISLGGEDANPALYLPADPTKPNRIGRLSVWVAPPTARFSTLTLVGTGGGIVFPDTVLVAQRDLYEPNDTVPWHLGDIEVSLENPALAFEPRGRSDQLTPADWYTFTNTTQRDRTIIVFSEFVGAATFTTFMTDSLWWNGAAQDFGVGSKSWTIGPETYLCDGKSVTRFGEPVTFNEQVFPFSIISLKDLPAGTYHVFVPYLSLAEPRSYTLLIATGYLSSIPRDVAEENDYCDVAKDVSITAGETLTIDNPHDIDWYKFTTTDPLTNVSFSVAAGGSVSPNLPNPDLDLYIVRDFRPDSLVFVKAATTEGPNESISAVVPAGDYFLVVVDFPGSPVSYAMSSAFGAAPFNAAGAALIGDDGWSALAAKRAALRRGLDMGERLRKGAAPRR